MARPRAFDEHAVLQKAVNLFWKKGFYATSMQDLVDHLGISRASMYATFGNKEMLFEQALQQYRKENTDGLRSFLDQQVSVREGLEKLFRNAIQETVADGEHKGCFVVNTATERVPQDERMITIIRDNQAVFEGVFRDFLQKGVDSGELSPNLDTSAWAKLLFTLYNGIKVVGKTTKAVGELTPVITAALEGLP